MVWKIYQENYFLWKMFFEELINYHFDEKAKLITWKDVENEWRHVESTDIYNFLRRAEWSVQRKACLLITNLKYWPNWANNLAKYWAIGNIDPFEPNIDQFKILTNLSQILTNLNAVASSTVNWVSCTFSAQWAYFSILERKFKIWTFSCVSST